MAGFVRQHASALVFSVLLHVLLLSAIVVGFRVEPRRVPIVPMAIEATLVDESAIRRERQRRQAEEQARVKAREDEQRRVQERAAAAERAVIQEQQRQQDQRAAAERQRQQRAEEQRQAKLRAEREAKVRAEAAAAARQQAAMEAELQVALLEEEERQAAEDAGLLDQYVRLIEQRIERNWNRPATAAPGLECVVKVTQIPSGDVVSVRIGRCNGDEAVTRSIEAAVWRASPLPKPPHPRLFDRNLEVVFKPDQ